MKNNTKKILVFSVLGMFMLMFAAQMIVAAEENDEFIMVNSEGNFWTISNGKSGGVHQPIENPDWLKNTTQFLGFGESWADLIIALAVILIIFSAAYDILAFTAFETEWVKYVIAGGIAIAFGLLGGIGWFAKFMVNIAGGSVMIATIIAIVLGILFFIGGTWFKGKMMSSKYKTQAQIAEGAYELAKVSTVGKIKEAKAAAKAAKEK